MVIWAHTLFKNEERWLWYSVTSVIDHVDKLLLWDTGSTDKSWQIAKLLKEKYEDKIELKQYGPVTAETFPKVRQKMLEATNSDWFLVIDADEIWWQDSIQNLLSVIKDEGNNLESIVVPVVVPVGDIFHRQEEKSGRYKLAGRIGHLGLRAINRKIPGLHSSGDHGVWGWVDGERRMIQDRNQNKIYYLDKPYLHTTHLERSREGKDSEVLKRKMKRKYEIGDLFPKDFYYPEVFFKPVPGFIESPWKVMNFWSKLISFIETPFRKIKRRLWVGKAGY